MELQAAVLGTRLATIIENDGRSYKPFVDHRISVLDASSVKDWRWIPTKFNVADDCTKWLKVPEYN